MALVKNVRALVLIVLSILSLIVLILPAIMSQNALIVSSISPDAQCSYVNLGNRINQIAGKNVKTQSDFNNALIGVKKGDFVSLLADFKPANCVAIADSDLGFRISTSKGIVGFEIGSDIGGGSVYNYKADTQLSQTQISDLTHIIQQREKIFGFGDVVVNSDNNFIKITTSNPDANTVLYPGLFEARLEENIPVQGSKGNIPVGSNKYEFSISNNSFSILSQNVPIGGKFTLEGIDFFLENITGTSVVVEAKIFNNSGILQEYPQSSTITLDQNSQQYMFSLPVSVSANASNNFLKVAANAPNTLINGQISIDGSLDYFLDGQLLSKLAVPLDFAKQPLTGKQIAVIGFSHLQSDAANSRIRVLASLESGVIYAHLSLDSQQPVQATRENLALGILGGSLIFALATTVVVPTIRYKNAKGGMLAFLFIIMEILAVLGIIYAEVSVIGINLVINFFTVLAFSFVIAITSLHFMTISEKNHSGKGFEIKFGYKKIFGMNVLIYFASAIVAIFFAAYFDVTFGVIVFLSILIDWLLIKPLFEKFVRKTF